MVYKEVPRQGSGIGRMASVFSRTNNHEETLKRMSTLNKSKFSNNMNMSVVVSQHQNYVDEIYEPGMKMSFYLNDNNKIELLNKDLD